MTALNSAAPVVPGSADGSVRSLAKTAAQSKLTAGIIYDELVRAARAGEPCPSNTELSRLVGASSVATPAHSIGRMAKAGRLRVTHASNGRDPRSELVERAGGHHQIAVRYAAGACNLVGCCALAYAEDVTEVTLPAEHVCRGFQPHHSSHTYRIGCLFRVCGTGCRSRLRSGWLRL
jgi:hypothetical protein